MVDPLAVITAKYIKNSAAKPPVPPVYEDTEKATTTLKEEPLDPEEEDLEEEAVRYHNDWPYRLLSNL